MPIVDVVKCEECNSLQLAPIVVCRQCGAGNVKKAQISGKGKLYTYTIIHVPPENWNKQVPYVVGVLSMEGGLLLTASYIEGCCNELMIGDEFSVMVEDGRFVFK